MCLWSYNNSVPLSCAIITEILQFKCAKLTSVCILLNFVSCYGSDGLVYLPVNVDDTVAPPYRLVVGANFSSNRGKYGRYPDIGLPL